jgi:hypothetical protein
MNEQSNRRAMIRRVRAKSSVCYPEVFHRFCGYLRGVEKFLEISSCAESHALSSSRRMNFGRLAKKVSRQLLLREQCSRENRGENAVAATHQLRSLLVGPVAQWLVQGTHRQTVPSRRKPRSGRDEFREPFRSCCAGMRECRGAQDARERPRPMATLSQAGGTPPEGAETT